jgi:hypothetical protein
MPSRQHAKAKQRIYAPVINVPIYRYGWLLKNIANFVANFFCVRARLDKKHHTHPKLLS